MQTYTRTAIWLHWVMALLVLALLVVGFSLPEEEGPARSFWIHAHKSFGFVVWALFVVRLGWRLTHRPPAPPAGVTALQHRIAEAVHGLLYLLLFVQPLLGYLSASFSGYPMKWFGVELPHWGWKDSEINHFFTECHEVSAFVLIALVLVHSAAALHHAFVRRNGMLRRMGVPLG
jgi:cytochrome b561